MMNDSLSPREWTGLLTTRALGRGENRVEDLLPSTNLTLEDMARQGAPHGSLCIAEEQTAGRGRLGRSWSAPKGKGLWLSVLLRPKMKAEDAPHIILVSAVAMARAVRDAAGLNARVKWPNDLVYQGRKLCGTMLKVSVNDDGIQWVIVGTGLNVHEGAYPPELRDRAAAIAEFTAPPRRSELLVRYLSELEAGLDTLEREGFRGIEGDYRALSCTLGREVRVIGSEAFTGIAEDLDDTGALLVRTADGKRHRVLAGDVSVRGVMGYV